MKPWHEQDAFWENMADHMFTPARLQEAATDADQVVKLASVHSGATVLDLCCGPGRHSIELARKGFVVKGVDRTKTYIEQARLRARELGLESTDFAIADMRTFREPNTFDLVINLFTSFGYFDDPNDDRLVMENIYDSLRVGGKLLMDVLGKEVLASKFRPHDWYEEGGVLFLEERVLSRDWGWIDSRWIRIEGAQRTEFGLSHRLYSAAELAGLASQVGFKETRAYGSLEGIPYDHRASRLILLAKK